MIVKIGNRTLKHYNDITVHLNYDSVCSTFSYSVYFDPQNADHKAMFKPSGYQPVTIEHNGELLLTGVQLQPKFTSSAVRELTTIAGYSKTGVLEDCEIPLSAYPLQANGLSLKQITEKILKALKPKNNISLVVDSLVNKEANSVYKTTTASDKQKIKEYICELAAQKHIIVTHNEKGELVFTKAKTTQNPIYHFDKGIPCVKKELIFEGQKMHSSITLQKQATKSGKGNVGISTLENPYANGTNRPRVHRQTSGTDVDTEFGARSLLSEELQAVGVLIELDRWKLNDKIIKPNDLITVIDPDIYIYEKTQFFIVAVELHTNGVEETARLTCVLPEVYNNNTPKNIFE